MEEHGPLRCDPRRHPEREDVLRPALTLEGDPRTGTGGYYVVTPTLLQLKALPEVLALFGEKISLGSYTGSPVKVFRFSEKGSRRMSGDTGREPGPVNVSFGHSQDSDSPESAMAKAAWLDEAGSSSWGAGRPS